MDNDLYVKAEKCEWKKQEVEFLGDHLGPNGIRMDDKKVKAITEWPVPKRVKDVQKFLGLANFYQRFTVSKTFQKSQSN